MLGPAGAENVPPQAWVAWLMVFAAGVGAGFAAARVGARRAVRLVLASLFALAVVSLLASLLLHLDMLFAPMMLAGLGSLCAVQARRLWLLDAALSRNVARAAGSAAALEGDGARVRLTGGLKLLDAVLALEEATVFRVVEAGERAVEVGDRVAVGRLGEHARREVLLGQQPAHDAEGFEPLLGRRRREERRPLAARAQ